MSNQLPSGHDLAHAEGQRKERAAVIRDLERMLAVCEYAEIKAFIPLLINRLRNGLHRG